MPETGGKQEADSRNRGQWQPGESGNPETQFLPGKTGNPNGRPRGTSLPKLIRKLLEDPELVDKVITIDEKGKSDLPSWWGSMEEKTFATAVVMAMIQKAIRGGGNEKAAKWLSDSGYGMKFVVDAGDDEVEDDLDELDAEVQREKLAEEAERALNDGSPSGQDDPEERPPAPEQVVADDAPLQNPEQAGEAGSVPTEQDATSPPS